MRWSLIVFVCLVVVGLGVGFFFLYERSYVWTNDAQIEGFQMDLGTNVTEQVTGLFVEEGDVVTRGQLIAQLQNDVPLAQKLEAEARISQIEQDIRAQEARRAKIRNDYIRALEGIEEDVISAQDFDHAQKDLEIADAELALAYASLELAVAELEVIEAELGHYTIVAPQDGTIAKRWVWLGDVVTPGQSFYTMYDLENVWVTARLEEGKLEGVRLGAPVDIHVDAYPDYTFEGEVFTIKAAAASEFTLVPQNNATGNYTKVAQRVPIKITIRPPADFPKDQPLYLFPGMNVEVKIKT